MALATGELVWRAMIELAGREADHHEAARVVTERFGGAPHDNLREAMRFGAADEHMEGETMALRAMALLDQVLRAHAREL